MSEKKTIREESKHNFLSNFFLKQEFKVAPIVADASFRTYDRITCNNDSFILMNSPPEHYNLEPFIHIAQFLLNNNFSAPNLFHLDHENGFLLLEDFGSISVSSYLLSADNKLKMYQLIMDVLIKLQSIEPPPDLPVYTNDLLMAELELFIEWYIPYIKGGSLKSAQNNEFLRIWHDILDMHPLLPQSIVLRDYHVENMMVLDRAGINSIGLLDFQDALLGSPLYDVVSVLEDARINVDTELAKSCLDYYIAQTPQLKFEDAYLSYHILGAQRNSRILGVFARKYIRDGQKSYLNYIPRVLTYIQNDLSHPALAPLKDWMERNL